MTLKKRPAMHISWFEALQSEFNEEYMEDLRNFLIDKKFQLPGDNPP
jgi:uracil DNA glycosylase